LRLPELNPKAERNPKSEAGTVADNQTRGIRAHPRLKNLRFNHAFVKKTHPTGGCANKPQTYLFSDAATLDLFPNKVRSLFDSC
jgi:hypothetical protein